MSRVASVRRGQQPQRRGRLTAHGQQRGSQELGCLSRQWREPLHQQELVHAELLARLH
jgi:hypothetical protein